MKLETPDRTTSTGSMHARDVMTAEVVTVGPDEPITGVAHALLAHGISAVPVINNNGEPIGMVSEGDLIGRDETERLARSDWWLALVSGRQALDGAFQARLRAADRTARDVMSAPLVTVTEETGVSEIARLFAIHHIKRVPVVRDGRMVGIVSRADLLRAMAAGQFDPAAPDQGKHRNFLAGLFGEHHLPARETVAGNTPSAPAPKPDQGPLGAADFQHLVEDFRHGEAEHEDAVRRGTVQQRCDRARALIDAHVLDEGWRQLMHGARMAAESGQKETMLLRFPCQLCIDGGRAINVAEPDWPATLRGRSAEIYLRWERDLKAQGFLLSARVLDFPNGKPGDVGLFLVWSE
jgi:CBS domain-containing protein